MMRKTQREKRSARNIVFTLLLSLSFALTACSQSADNSTPSTEAVETQTEKAAFAGGNGTAEDPYQISNAEQLDNMRSDLTANYVLTADIDLSGYDNWKPIGEFQPKSDAPEDAEVPKEEVAFRGTFDGNSHKISNLTIDAPQSMAVGLFGCVTGNETSRGFIKNLSLENVNVNGAYLVGGIVGLQFMNFEVDGITLSGTNKLSGMQGVGGIVGTGFDWIRNCSAEADITILGNDGACAGIVAGGTTFSSIENCTATGGSITADGDACWGLGGICGAPYAASEIKNCKASDVLIRATGEKDRLIGGIVGFAGTYAEGTVASIEDCAAAKVNIEVSGTASCVGGIIGGPKEESEDSSTMSAFTVLRCSVSGTIKGGADKIGSVAGDETNAAKLDCTGEMTLQ